LYAEVTIYRLVRMGSRTSYHVRRMNQIATLQTIQIGTPHRYRLPSADETRARFWETSFFRDPSAARRWLSTTRLEGNAQADTKNHGSPDQAVLMYAAAHYPIWQAEFGRPEIGPGGFGENFTVAGLAEDTACIGDVYAIGEARVQVTGPRYPCTKINRRWGIPTLLARVAETGRTGWYLRVLSEGWVEPGLPIALLDRPHPEVTIALVNDFGHSRNRDVAWAKEVAACPLLGDWWGRLVVARAMGKEW
jgi:MOSC domain-containing protein YiiM